MNWGHTFVQFNRGIRQSVETAQKFNHLGADSLAGTQDSRRWTPTAVGGQLFLMGPARTCLCHCLWSGLKGHGRILALVYKHKRKTTNRKSQQQQPQQSWSGVSRAVPLCLDAKGKGTVMTYLTQVKLFLSSFYLYSKLYTYKICFYNTKHF